MTQIEGARALVTGATGGLGHAITEALRQHGAEVVVTGRRADVLERIAAETGTRPVVGDLSERADTARILQEAGDIDILVANAALPGSGRLEDWTEEQVDRIIEVNLTSPIQMTRLLLPQLLARGRGHFVFISSLSGKAGTKAASMYSATKFGLRGFAASLRCDLHGTDLGCSTIFPGFVRDAGMFADSGATLPRGVGTVSPAQVAAAVIKALRTNKAEIDVAPITLKLGALIGGVAPGISSSAQARLDRGLSDQMIPAQSEKR